MNVPEKFVVTFKPGKEMEAKVQKLELEAAAEAARQQMADLDDSSDEPELVTNDLRSTTDHD